MNVFREKESFLDWVRGQKTNGLKIVATNGCFDLLHVGHVRYLNQAKELGDLLVVGINSDRAVKELKGEGRPLNTEADRAEVLLGLKAVDAVFIFDDQRATDFLDLLKPHLYVKGGDYTEASLNQDEVSVLKSCGAEIKILSLVEGRSTTNTLKKMGTNHAT